MTYDRLLMEAEKSDLLVKEKPLKGYGGRIKGNRIAIKQDLSFTEKACVLVEELGHYHTNAGNILDQTQLANRKQERIALDWAFEKLVPLYKIITAVKSGVRTRHELAESLNVTEQFLDAALKRYQEKHGIYQMQGGDTVIFEPLGILFKI